MSDKAGAGGAAYMHNNKDEIYVKPCIPTAVVITSYRDLLACNGNLGLGPRVKNTLQDEDTWSMIVNIDEPNRKGKDADKNWVLTVSNKRSR